MTELLVYAPGLRAEDKLMQLGHQMDMLAARYKIDARHEMVYFEIDDPQRINMTQLNDIFEHIGLAPRFIGQIPEALNKSGDGAETDKLE
jgi:hypothetical protein